jgi:glycosyltransferase involved in cell wall biosynthesis
MTKLVIQIPCYDEEEALPTTLACLPRELPGVDSVEWLVIDDGSSDGTVEVARKNGVDHIVALPRHQGLARAFVAGLEAATRAGADIIVNTDADNQYRAEDIPRLIAPILAGEAQIVVGERPIAEISHFSTSKKQLQRVGSWVTRKLSGTNVADAPSGFRAMTREAALKLHVFSDYTYTIETIIQAGQKGMAVTSVPIRTNSELRSSRLISNVPRYIQRQVLTMARIFMTYKPFRFFALPGAITFAAGFLIGLRFLWFYATGGGSGHVQSLILSALLMGAGGFLVLVGFLADLISVNRKLLEGVDWRLRKVEDALGPREK